MNRLFRSVLGLFAAPRLNVREDYAKVRRFQQQVAALTGPRYRPVYRQTAADVGTHRVPVRIFQPKEKRRDEVLLFFHGGGWVTGDIESYTPACAAMADLTGCVVASVDYRLAPEQPFPAGLEDCFHVARMVLEHPQRAGIGSATNVVLVGDSAGGNLAAAVSLMLRDRGHRGASRQILLYPVTHWDHDPATSPFASVRHHGEDYRLTSTEVQDYFDLYVPDHQRRRNPLVAPLMAPNLSGQPKTLLITAELDLLCDEGEAYGEALAEAGNEVRAHRVDGALHGFIALPRFSRSLREAYEVINVFLDEDSPVGEQPVDEQPVDEQPVGERPGSAGHPGHPGPQDTP
ncbi:alpha/beta hydrolase [Citricoccus zhacaiensis]|uniref:Alpha/beta hydrolase n=1 Tax=Citricoccus zhacaiensis TaxID=489142 RepID=A0ABQ2M9X9_9MICC|nr:alpha/beta hydrolase [Citricoccus zhacaiensis]GGO48492.1 alpha/beta hydrolase [Citricoccus zhacaiensis]